MAHILLYEPEHADLPHLVFLLKLAGISCTASRSADETLNWLNAERLKVVHFDLLLLSRMQGLEKRDEAWQALRRSGLPIVCIKRQSAETVPLPEEDIISCYPDALLDCIKTQIFSEKKQPRGEEFMTSVTQSIEDAVGLDADSMEGMYLTFDLAEEGYGLEIRHVVQIIGIQTVTKVPDMPEHVIGVVNLRGKVIPIIDVRLRFRLASREFDDRTCIIVVDVQGSSVGLVVDKVSEVVAIPEQDIEPSPAAGQNRAQYIQGMGKLNNQVKILLDIEQLISSENLDESLVEMAEA
jgi:purine-binding chemotaxis protein CheW